MNNPGLPQGAGGQRPQQDPTARLVKVQHVRSLAHIPEVTKAKWVSAIDNYSSIVSSNPPESQQYKNAMTGWMQLTKAAVESSKNAKNNQNPGPQSGGPSQQQAQQQQAQQQQAQQQQAQQQAQQQQAQAQVQAQAQAQQSTPQMNQTNQGQQFQPQRPAQWPPAIRKHVDEITLYPPPGIALGTPQYETWLPGAKEKYGMILYQHEAHKASTAKITTMLKGLREQGKEMPPQMMAEGKKHSDALAQAKQRLDAFRVEQAKWKANSQQQNNMSQQGQQQDQNGSAPSSSTISQQPFQLKLPNHPNQSSTAQGQQNPSVGMNPSVEAARNAAANTTRNSMSPTQQHPPQMGQAPTSFAATQQGSNNTMGQQQQQPHHQLGAPQQHRPSLSAQQPMNSMPHQHNSQGGNMSGPPLSLSHTQAMAKAQRTYSERQTPQSAQPNSLGQNNSGYSNQGQGQQTPNREHSNTASSAPKISKNLPPHLYNTPPAVPFPAARPTLSGPSNGVGGMMGQPAIAKPPAFQLEGDQGSGVLSKKKLDELVRQVTGGGEAMNRETLTPEVEEAMLNLADEFVDNVITAACRLAKLRESQTLEIKDIQLILERNYGIRIPGYASDEIRAIKKYAPAPGWTHKMNAVQAAKVMGGKTDI